MISETTYDPELESLSEAPRYGFFERISNKLESLGVEAGGIERVEPHERATSSVKQYISVAGLWISACGGLPSMSTFYLGPLLYGLGLRATLISGILGICLGSLVTAYCSLMGPRSGCRQMVGARFLFGWWFVKFICFLSFVNVAGWSVVNSVVGGQILSAMSNGKVPLVVAIIIIALTSLLVSIGGIKYLLRFETLLSVPVNIALLLLYIVASNKFEYLSNANDPSIDAATAKGNIVSFFSLCFSLGSSYSSVVSDYYILFPEDTPDIKVFCLTYFGVLVPIAFVGTVGILIGNVALNYAPWGEAYTNSGIGGLLNEVFSAWGNGGKFLLAVLFLSLIANNIMNSYSAAFEIQLTGVKLAKVPRWVWAIVFTIIYLVCAIAGRSKLSVVLGNFLPMMGYWILIYVAILFEENTIFRSGMFYHLYKEEAEQEQEIKATETPLKRPSEDLATQEPPTYVISSKRKPFYNFAIWNDYERLTKGIAATVAFICGAAGAAVGMSQVYWVGPLAEKAGGDIGMWLCMGFSGLIYPFARYWELKRFGK